MAAPASVPRPAASCRRLPGTAGMPRGRRLRRRQSRDRYRSRRCALPQHLGVVFEWEVKAFDLLKQQTDGFGEDRTGQKQTRSPPRNCPSGPASTRTRSSRPASILPASPSSAPSSTAETAADLTERVLRAVHRAVALDRTPLTHDEHRQLVGEITDEILVRARSSLLRRDETVTEVMVDDPDMIYIERGGRSRRRRCLRRRRPPAWRSSTDRDSRGTPGRRVVADGRRAPTGRIARQRDHPAAGLAGPVLPSGSSRIDPFTMDSSSTRLVDPGDGAVHAGVRAGGKLNILISGGTGAGKTTPLNALWVLMPGDERIVTIEDAAELRLQQEHVVSLETRLRMSKVKGEVNTRSRRERTAMRPDRIIVGEVPQSAERSTCCQAMNTGHEGSLTTIRESPRGRAVADRRRSC